MVNNNDLCSLSDVINALQFIDCDDRDIWVRMGMAIKQEFGEEGFDVFDGWSQGYAEYKFAAVRSVWRSFKGRGIGIGTLFKLAINNGYKPAQHQQSESDLKKLKQEQEERRKKREIELEQEEKILAQLQVRVSVVALDIWERLDKQGSSDYLERKQVDANGIRFFKYGVITVTDELKGTVDVIRGSDNINYFFKNKPSDDNISFLYHKAGSIALPMRGADGKLWNLQVINPTGDKKFLKGGRKQGTFHSIGKISPESPLCVVEGYATGATVFKAVGWPVAIAWDATNLKPVCNDLHDKYPDIDLLVCGDDDRKTKGNPGRTKANEAATAVGAKVVFPDFSGCLDVS